MAANLDVTGQIWVFLTAIIIVKHPLITFVLIGRRTVRSDAHYKKTTILFDTVKTAIQARDHKPQRGAPTRARVVILVVFTSKCRVKIELLLL